MDIEFVCSKCKCVLNYHLVPNYSPNAVSVGIEPCEVCLCNSRDVLEKEIFDLQKIIEKMDTEMLD